MVADFERKAANAVYKDKRKAGMVNVKRCYF
jgi:hypothetical protein